MENTELEQVENVAEVVAESNTLHNVLKAGGILLGIASVVGLGYVVVKRIKAKKEAAMDTVEYSEVEPQEETEE